MDEQANRGSQRRRTEVIGALDDALDALRARVRRELEDVEKAVRRGGEVVEGAAARPKPALQ
jgi:hypothetical protein